MSPKDKAFALIENRIEHRQNRRKKILGHGKQFRKRLFGDR